MVKAISCTAGLCGTCCADFVVTRWPFHVPLKTEAQLGRRAADDVYQQQCNAANGEPIIDSGRCPRTLYYADRVVLTPKAEGMVLTGLENRLYRSGLASSMRALKEVRILKYEKDANGGGRKPA